MLVPFTFFALLHNPNSFVELIVKNKIKFKETYNQELLKLKKICGNHFMIRNFSFKLNRHVANTYRFFEVPIVKGKYTYIIDIDIMILDNISESYLKNWPDPKIPYNNIIRPASNRLTGVHFVKTKEYYTSKLLQSQTTWYKNKPLNDEMVLYNICKESHGLIKKNFQWRPILGIHFSPNRGPTKSMDLETSKKYYDKYMNITKQYSELFQFDIFNNLTIMLNTLFKIA